MIINSQVLSLIFYYGKDSKRAAGSIPFITPKETWGFTFEEMPDQTGRIIIITGANVGLGLSSAKLLAMKNAKVIMACRSAERCDEAAKKVKEVAKKLKRNIKLLIGKPGLDGHSNGAEQIAMRAKEAGFDVVYQGIRLTPNQIVNSALEESVHIIGLSILSGSHLEILEDLTNLLKTKNLTKIPVIVGGIIPEKDFEIIRKMGVKKVYTPKDYDLNTIISDMSDFVEQSAA